MKQNIVKKLESLKIEPIIEIPSDPKLGDYALPCFSLAKEREESPAKIATALAEDIGSIKGVDKIVATGPYVNFFVNTGLYASEVLWEAIHRKYGKEQFQPDEEGVPDPRRKTVLVEGWQPNTHKAFHIGHIRNAVLSESIARQLEFVGHFVLRVSYMGDVGAHVAKWLWYITNFYRGEIPSQNVSKWAGQLYTEATKKAKEKEEYKEQIHKVHKRLEDGDEQLTALWETTREKCLQDFYKIFDELGCTIKRHYFESEVEKPGVEKVKQLAKEGKAKISEGAIIKDLEEHDLGVFVLLKSNGASLYSTKDIALAYLKAKEYKFDVSLYVVANEQDHHFRQLFKTLELIGYPKADTLTHASYGMVKLQDGKMSSRLGNIILYEDLRDKLMEEVHKVMADRELSEEKKEEIARSVAFGAMKFAMLAQDAPRDIIFDFDQALSFDGETGPYVQYTHARCASLIRKYGKNVVDDVDFTKLERDEEKEIIKLLDAFPDTARRSAEEYKPNHIARLVLDLCQAFNAYYHKHQIITEDDDMTKTKILMVMAVKNVINKSLWMLGIDALEEM